MGSALGSKPFQASFHDWGALLVFNLGKVSTKRFCFLSADKKELTKEKTTKNKEIFLKII
jgi:hypothetical protein